MRCERYRLSGGSDLVERNERMFVTVLAHKANRRLFLSLHPDSRDTKWPYNTV